LKLSKKIFIWTQHFVVSILYLSLFVSLAALFIYLLDPNLNDNTLFFLLILLRYSAFILCICSLYKLLVNIYHTIRRPKALRAMKNVLYIVFIIYGTVIVFIETFISVIAGGNA